MVHVDWDRFPQTTNPQTPVSNNFRFYELTKSDIAERRGIDNGFGNERQCHAAVYLCRKIMQPIRDHFGVVKGASVFRSQALERVLKDKLDYWFSNSQHTMGQACDVEVSGIPNITLASWVERNLTFDQLILECHDSRKGPNSGWVHVSRRPPGQGKNRHEVLSYVRSRGGEYVYVPGLRESV